MKRFFAIWIAALFVAIVPGQTKAQNAAVADIVSGVSYEDIAAIVGAYGHSYEMRSGPNGSQMVAAQTQSGFRYLVGLAACGTQLSAQCLGIELTAIYNPGNGNIDMNALNTFEAQNPFIRVYLAPTQEAVLVIVSRYTITDYGVSRKNILSNFGNFFAYTEQRTGGGPSFGVSLENGGEIVPNLPTLPGTLNASATVPLTKARADYYLSVANPGAPWDETGADGAPGP